jgi:CRISPR-associated endonuclease/helicase Cas3
MNEKVYIAHVRKDENQKFHIQTMEEHLNEASQLAASFSSKFQNAEWGRLLGKWHDLGKYSAEFQDYIKIISGYIEGEKLGKTDHTSAGAIFAKELLPQMWPPFAYCIAGHHAGLHNWYPEIGISGDLSDRLKKQEFLDKIRTVIPKELGEIEKLNVPTGKPIAPEQMHLWIRMLFSCLVDADYLDTERFMNPESFAKRGKYTTLKELKVLFDNHMVKLSQNAPATYINRIRDDVFKQCIRSGKKEPGFFSITVPTGGGKTLSTMAWALEHAAKYNKSRIIFAIPYTSIITQTVQVYRDIFGEANVIEHHSNIDEEANLQDQKLATENWDAPIVVTTNVQLFESLYANKTSRCRKLHNLVNSIIILDEAQMLPPDFLKPILSVLKGLVENFNVSVLFSTATQPTLTGTIGSGQNTFNGIEINSVRDIVIDYFRLSTDLKRVQLLMPENINQPTEWSEIADELKEYEQVLCIVNTRKDCRELYNLMPERTVHLSRMMCSAHILDTIAVIKQKLKDGEPIKVISTQLIEAGVDVDFPIVYRALAGLDSVAQCAGRCNREGKLNKGGKLGLTKVFCTAKGTPPGLMRKGADTLKEMLQIHNDKDFLDPKMFQQYFSLFYSKVQDFDKPKIKSLLWQDAMQMKFQFATAARDFRLIDDKGAQSIIIEYKEGADLIELLKRKGPESWLMRKLQRYSVSVNAHDFEEIRKAGLILQVHGCWIQANEMLYKLKAGLMSNGEWLEEIHII